MEKAIVAGGCFWCIESAFMHVTGVEKVRSGYTGGDLADPNYEQVVLGNTGHFEGVEITFDPEKITFLQILEIFWRHIDPLDEEGQFADRGKQYQTAIFYQDERQKMLALLSRAAVQTLFDRPIATQILPVKIFYPAEDYHQAYCVKQPDRYQAYAASHAPFLQRLWEEKQIPITKDILRYYLTPMQYHVTQEEGTEPPFENSFWNDEREGIYVDIVSGEPLFLSSDKFDSHCGWPSFSRPIDDHQLQELDDYKLGVHRTEVRSKQSNAHLGHVFPDGPGPEGLRYCINSAALRFIPKEKMEEEGYGQYLDKLN